MKRSIQLNYNSPMKSKTIQLFAAGILLLFASCGDKKAEENNSSAVTNENLLTLTDAQVKSAAVESGKMELRNISSVLKVNGFIDVPPQNMVSISAPLGGYLKSSNLLPGMHVAKGQSIAVMEDQQYIQLQQDFLTAQANLVFVKGEYNRQKELNQSKATSDKLFQKAEADYKSQSVLVKALSEKLKLININPDKLEESNLSRTINLYSPIDGYVTDVNVNIGKYVNPSEVLFEIVDPSDIHLALNVFENDINKLFVGQKITAMTNDNSGRKYNCEIILIGKELTDDKSIEVHCHFDEYDKALIPGMYMNAEIELKSDSVYTLPEDAILSFEKKQYVFLVKENNQFEMQEVKTGNSENGFTEVVLDKGDVMHNQMIVTKGAYSLLMALKNMSEE